MTEPTPDAGLLEVTLKPCPFCGGEAVVESPTCGFRVHCLEPDCDAAGPWPNDCTEAEAITAWNTRAPVQQSASPSGLVEAGCIWLRERAATCKEEAVNRFERDDEEAGEEWRVRGETYGFVADQIERGYTPFTTNCGDPGASLCGACSQPITELTQQPGCGASLTSPAPADARTAEVERFLTAYVSEDAKIIGIEHDTDADWHAVHRAHEALRDRLNVRLAERERCPFKPALLTPTTQQEQSR